MKLLAQVVFVTVVAALMVCGFLAYRGNVAATFLLVPLGALFTIALVDRFQTKHTIRRNFPIIGNLRYTLESIGPELHQYFVENNLDGRPYARDERSLVYQRAKNIDGLKPFGTELDVYHPGYEWLAHSMLPKSVIPEKMFVHVAAAQPYRCSLFNISAMSFGALSPAAIRALNQGAKAGGFAHNTGEGGLSEYHLASGGDLIWQIGTGYFGCRTAEGRFDPEKFQERAANRAVRMIEIKLSQGAKPGHGGILPAEKVSAEIARIRGVNLGADCVSPPGHSAFTTPIELCAFVAKLRELSRGKPIGVKLCLGRPIEFLAFCKAMIVTGVTPDFITVDGGEGGTGAAPLEFSDSVGAPLRDGLLFVRNALVGANLREKVKIACSGKVTSAFDIAKNLALGADWCNAARAFMLSLGCIQAQACHTNRCPSGVATQDKSLQRGLIVADKAERVQRFQQNTLRGLADLVGAAGLNDPRALTPEHFFRRRADRTVVSFAEIYPFLQAGQLIDSNGHSEIDAMWKAASVEKF